MARFWIRLRATEIHLPLGDVLIGRGPECFLRVDEPVVSRRHARLRTGPDAVVVEDLGSRNGSYVNGARLEGPCQLRAGDVLTVGSQQFTLECDEEPTGHMPTGQHRVVDPRRPALDDPAPTPAEPAALADAGAPLPMLSSASLGHCSNCGAPQGDAAICPRCGHAYRNEFTDMPTTNTGQASSYQLFWALSDKVLAMGRVDEAERMMGPRLQELLERAEAGNVPQEGMVAESVTRALRLAAATRRERWLAWVFDYARLCRYRLPLLMLDELYAQIFALRPALGARILAYAQSLEDDTLNLRLNTLRRLCRD